MSKEELRLECLKIACERGLPQSEVLKYAEELWCWVSDRPGGDRLTFSVLGQEGTQEYRGLA